MSLRDPKGVVAISFCLKDEIASSGFALLAMTIMIDLKRRIILSAVNGQHHAGEMGSAAGGAGRPPRWRIPPGSQCVRRRFSARRWQVLVRVWCHSFGQETVCQFADAIRFNRSGQNRIEANAFTAEFERQAFGQANRREPHAVR